MRRLEQNQINILESWLPGPAVRNGPVRSVVRILFGPDFFDPVRGTDILVRIFLVRSVVRIFWSGFFWSGPWSGYFGPDFIGPVLVRIFGPDNAYRSGFFRGPVRGPDFFYFLLIFDRESDNLVEIFGFKLFRICRNKV